MGLAVLFYTIHESHYTISTNFYLYLQYFQQKVFSFSFSKINGFQIDLFFLLYFFSPLTHSLLSFLFSILLDWIKVSLILKGSSIMIFCNDLSGSSRTETDQREWERGTEMGFLRWVWWFPTMGAKVAGLVFIFCSGVVVLVWIFCQRECENLLILLEGRGAWWCCMTFGPTGLTFEVRANYNLPICDLAEI